jgi:hypothetical protein
MRHAGRLRVRDQVASGCREEVHHGLLFERGRIRDVDDDRCALQHFPEPFAGDRVHAGIGRGRRRLMSVFTKLRHELGSDQSSAADDYEFHSVSSPLEFI